MSSHARPLDGRLQSVGRTHAVCECPLDFSPAVTVITERSNGGPPAGMDRALWPATATMRRRDGGFGSEAGPGLLRLHRRDDRRRVWRWLWHGGGQPTALPGGCSLLSFSKPSTRRLAQPGEGEGSLRGIAQYKSMKQARDLRRRACGPA